MFDNTMNIMLRYLNEFLDTITEAQAALLQSYVVDHFEDGLLKKREFYREAKSGKYKVTNYFSDSSENKALIIEQFTGISARGSCVIYFNMRASGEYSLWDWEQYSMEGILRLRGKTVLDANYKEFLIIDTELDSDTIKSAYKHYYGDVHAGEIKDLLLEFGYDKVGNLISICDVKGIYGYETKSIDLERFLLDTEFSQIMFPWDQHPYYHNLYPLLPESEII